MLVKDIMITDVKTIEPEATIQDAAKDMVRFKIGSLIVVKNEKLSGIMTDRDRIGKVVAEGKLPSGVKVKEIMTKDVIVITPDADIEEAVEAMIENNIKKLPVVSKGALVGIVTAVDLMASQPKLLEQIEKLIILTKRERPVAG